MGGIGSIISVPTGEKVKGDGGVGGRGVLLTFSDDIAKLFAEREINFFGDRLGQGRLSDAVHYWGRDGRMMELVAVYHSEGE